MRRPCPRPRFALLKRRGARVGPPTWEETEHRWRRTNRALRLLSACAEALPRASTEEELLHGLCRKVVEQGGYKMAWVGRAEDDEDRTVRPVAQAGFEDGYLESIRISWADVDLGRGPTGTAIREHRPVVIRDFDVDPRMAPWRAEAAARGYASSIALPIAEDDVRCLGAITIYSDERDAFDEGEAGLLMEVARQLAYGARALRERRALRESEERYRNIFGESSSVMLIIDPEGGAIVAANHAASAFYGWTQAELSTMRITQLIAVAPEVFDGNLRGILGGTLRRIEARHHLADGTLRDVEVFCGPILVAGRRLLHSVIHDITGRKRDEATLIHLARRAEALLALPRLSDHDDEAAFMQRGMEMVEDLTESRVSFLHFVDEDAQTLDLVTWSPRTLERYRTVPFERHYPVSLAGIWADALHQQRPVVVNDYAAHPDEKGPPDGHSELSRLVVVPVLEAGRVVMLFGVGNGPKDYGPCDIETTQLFANDIWRAVQRRRAEAARRQLSLVVEQSPESIAITDLAGDIRYVNEAFVRTTGYRRDELLGRNPRVLQSGKTPPAVYMDMWATLTRGETWRGEFTNRRKDDREYVEQAIVSPLRDADGRVTGYVGIKQDITETKILAQELAQHRDHLGELVETRTAELSEARRRAEDASKAKSLFLANMSHEIRTPMNAILGFAQLLRRDQALAAEQRRYVDTILHSGEHLLELINDILEMSRIEAGRVKLNRETLDLHAFFAGIQEMFSLAARSKGLRLRLDRGPDVPRHGMTDGGKLRQVLVNLVGNAVKFTREGEIAMLVRAGAEPALLAVEVRDTGIGISASAQAWIFRPFEQADAGRRAGGTGLGLAISQEFVRLLGGELRVASAVGEGSSFCFDIPIESVEAFGPPPPDPAMRARRLAPGQPPCRVLVVDDDATNRDLLQALLGRLGFAVRLAVDGPEARVAAAAWQPHLILMDLRMPGESGIEATRRIRALPAEPSPRIIAISASAFSEDRADALAAGADAFLSKPFREEDLLDEIHAQAGVTYADAAALGDAEPTTVLPTPLTARALAAAVPRELLGRLGDATRAADLEHLVALIGEVELSTPAIARALQERAVRFDYEALLELFDASARLSAVVGPAPSPS